MVIVKHIAPFGAHGCWEISKKWENADKQSPDYKKWFNKEYANWEEAVQKRMETYVRELRKKKQKLKDGMIVSY